MPGFEVEVSGRVAAPPVLVWEALTDLSSVAEWLDRVDEVDAGPEPVAGEGRWRVGRRWVVGGIVEVEPRRKLVLVLREATSLVRQVRVAIRIAPGDRGTAFHVHLAGDAAGIATPLRPWLRLRAEIELHRAVRGFRAWIEERARPERAPAAIAAAPALVPAAHLGDVDFVGA
ncbi:MAG TPA: SRPBCC family protein [Candidatus Binatia bacterium]|nr:SRPBCC family protein [Candidatus Binatia bacterium]